MRSPIDHIESLKEEQHRVTRVQLHWAVWCFVKDAVTAGRLTGTGRTRSLFPARSAMWRYRGTPFSAAPALHIASDTPRIELAPNLAGRQQKWSHTTAVWCGNRRDTKPKLTFVFGAVHLDHQVVQLLLLQHADPLTGGHTVLQQTVHPHLHYCCTSRLLYFFSKKQTSTLTHLRRAGPRVSLMWLMALLTPWREGQKVDASLDTSQTRELKEMLL